MTLRSTTPAELLRTSADADDRSVYEPASLLARLDDLRRRLVVSLLALLVGLVACFSISRELFPILMAPLKDALPEGARLVAIRVPEIFMVHVHAALVGALFVAAPVWLHQLWGFARGVYPLRKRTFLPAFLLGATLFAAGNAFGHFVLFPYAVHFLTSFGSSSVQILLSVSTVFSFYVQLVLGLGVAFQIPTVVLVLSQLRSITPGFLVRQLRLVILLAFAAAAVLTPTPDVVTQCLLALPLLGLYVLSIGLCWVVRRRG